MEGKSPSFDFLGYNRREEFLRFLFAMTSSEFQILAARNDFQGWFPGDRETGEE